MRYLFFIAFGTLHVFAIASARICTVWIPYVANEDIQMAIVQRDSIVVMVGGNTKSIVVREALLLWANCLIYDTLCQYEAVSNQSKLNLI